MSAACPRRTDIAEIRAAEGLAPVTATSYPVPLYLAEDDIDGLLTPELALEAVEGSFRRMSEGVVENVPRRRLGLDQGMLAVMSAADLGLGVAGVKTYAAGRGGASFVVVLFDAANADLVALIEADRLGQYRTGAATGVAAATWRSEARRRSVSSEQGSRRRCSFGASARRCRRSRRSSSTRGRPSGARSSRSDSASRRPSRSGRSGEGHRRHDGTGNPEPEDQYDRAIIPDGKPGAGGSFCIAQRWVHDLDYFNGLSLEDQENTFGRTKADSTKLADASPDLAPRSRRAARGPTGDDGHPSAARWSDGRRRTRSTTAPSGSTSWASAEQAPMRERMEAIYGMNGQARDALTDYSTPASGSFYFAPSSETLDAIIG